MEVTFEIDANGILNVSAKDKGTGKEEEISITAHRDGASQEQIDEMLRRAEEFSEEDDLIRAKIKARNELESYVYSVKMRVEDENSSRFFWNFFFVLFFLSFVLIIFLWNNI